MKTIVVALALVVFTLGVVVGCAAPAPTPAPAPEGTTYHWRWYGMNPTDHYDYQLAVETVKEIEENSDGRIIIDVYPAGQLGDWIAAYEQILRGAIDIGCLPVATQYDPRGEFIYMPYLATSYDKYEEIFAQGGTMASLVDMIIEPQGIKQLGVSSTGLGCIMLTREVASSADPDVDKTNVKIRVPPGFKLYEELAKFFGYNTASIPGAEIYMAEQTGVVEGHIGYPTGSAYRMARDVIKMCVQTNDHFEANFFLMNLDLWNSLSNQDQEIMANALDKNMSKSFDICLEDQEHLLREVMPAEGIQVVEPSEAELQILAERVRKEVWPVAKDRIGEFLYSKLEELVD